MEFPSLALETAWLRPANALPCAPSAKHNKIERSQNRPKQALRNFAVPLAVGKA
jgi:hypothetical protein